MMPGRSKPCVMKGSTQKAVLPFIAFIDRIRKSLYFGYDTNAEEMELSHPLAQYAADKFSESHKGHSLNRLNTVAAGNVHATPCSLIMALIYLDRINLTDPGYARRITPQELFIVSMMISTKFYAGHDEEIYLSDWAADGDITENRLKQLELDFLCAIEWNIYISNEQFFEELTNIEKTLAVREGLRRGWLTYTELQQMLPSFTLVKFLLNNITVMAVSYAASVMTIAGAFFLASQIPGTLLHRKATTATVTETVLPGIESAGILANATDTEAEITEANTTTATVVESIVQRNATCNALNVELELLKLERQYREEAELEALRHRNHELVSDYRLTLPDAAVANKLPMNGQAVRQQQEVADTKLNWLTLKEEFSELPSHGKPSGLLQLRDYFDGWYNGTNSIFWQMIGSEATQHTSLMRLPWPWFKFNY